MQDKPTEGTPIRNLLLIVTSSLLLGLGGMLLLIAYTIMNPRVSSQETWVSLKPTNPELICGSAFIAEGEDGQLVIGDYTNFDYMLYKYKEREVLVEAKTFTKSSGGKIPFWVIIKTRPKQ